MFVIYRLSLRETDSKWRVQILYDAVGFSLHANVLGKLMSPSLFSPGTYNLTFRRKKKLSFKTCRELYGTSMA